MTALQITALVPRAIAIKKTLGTQRAAAYLRNRHVPIEDAVQILATERFAK
jgi:hypothetical protein